MINIKKCRSEFLSLLNNLYNIDDDIVYRKIPKQINSLRSYIKNEYFYDKELPKISHQFIDNIQQDLVEIENLYNKFLLSKGYDLPEEAKIDAQNLIKRATELISQYQVNNTVKTINNSSDLTTILKLYCQIFGKINIIKALQSGIDIFCKERKDIFKPKKINIDGKIDSDFTNLVNEISNKYPGYVLEKYLVKGLMSNIIFETKNVKDINTKILLNEVNKMKKRRVYD